MADDAPWIDPVVVPDDISSLQPDIDAYHRECQHARRQRLRRRLASSTTLRRWGPLAGTMLGALALAAVVFVVLTVGDIAVRTRPAPAPIATGVTAPVGAQGGLLPVATLRTQAGEPVDIRGQRPSLVALLPLHCECADLVATLAGQATEVGVPLVVVAPAAADAEVAALPGRTHRGQVSALFDADHVLADTYASSQVTVLVVARDATVTYVQRDVSGDVRLEQHLFAALSSNRAGGQR